MTTPPVIRAALRDWRAARAEFQVYLEAQYARAQEDLGPHLLNARGQARGVDTFSLFYGPRCRADAWASEELRQWWDDHGRLTFQDWETQHGMVPGRSWGDLLRADALFLEDPDQYRWEQGYPA